MERPRATDEGLRIAQVAALTGVRVETLRIWELRFHWPRPGRSSNGFRVYPPSVVPQIIRVAALQKAGHQLKAILVDGLPHWPESGPALAAPTWSCLSQLPDSKTTDGEAFRLRLLGAIRQRNVAAIVRSVHEAVIVLRPGERLVAAWLPAYFGAREWQRAGRPLERDVGAVIGRIAGADTLADVVARWETAEAIG